MIIMSVDLGDARTGIAASDESETFAFPKDVIHEKNKDVLLQKLCDKAAELKAKVVVFGFPKNMDGSVGFKAQECAEMSERFAEATGIETRLWDERCTTVSAHTALNYTDTRGKKRKAVVDAVAATIILEDFLRNRNLNK